MADPIINVTVNETPAPDITVEVQDQPDIIVTVEETAVGPKGDEGIQGLQGDQGLQGEQGIPGIIIGQSFDFTQAMNIWEVTHTITNRRPIVVTLNINGDEIFGDVSYPAVDRVRVSWWFPEAGTLQVM